MSRAYDQYAWKKNLIWDAFVTATFQSATAVCRNTISIIHDALAHASQSDIRLLTLSTHHIRAILLRVEKSGTRSRTMEIHDSRPVDYRWHIMMMMRKEYLFHRDLFIYAYVYMNCSSKQIILNRTGNDFLGNSTQDTKYPR